MVLTDDLLTYSLRSGWEMRRQLLATTELYMLLWPVLRPMKDPSPPVVITVIHQVASLFRGSFRYPLTEHPQDMTEPS